MSFVHLKQLVVLCSLLVGTTIGQSAVIPQFVVNGSFESGLTGWTQKGCVQSGPPYFRLPKKNGGHVLDLGGGDISGAILQQRITFGPNFINSNYWARKAGPVTVDFDSAPKSIALIFDFGAIGGPVAVLRVTVLDELGRPLTQRIYSDSNPLSVGGELVSMRRVVIGIVVPGVNKSITLRFEDLSADGGVAVDPLIDNVRVLRLQP
ncbi:MAG: hypothetical protein JWM68_4172 [Verrucomicrobiales bacterium]|nr:hypothetical protein [Verrucomicrobiales bacterium]